MSADTLSFSQYVHTEVEIDVTLKEIADQLTAEQLAEIIGFMKNKGKPTSVPVGMGKGDPPEFRYIEAAYLAAKAMDNCPPAIRDLLWYVHGRAI